MVGLVLLLVAVFSSTLSSFLPIERSPTVTIMVTNDTHGNIIFWHKGGDWVRVSDLKIIVTNSQTTHNYVHLSGDTRTVAVPDAMTFDTGSNLSVHLDGLEGNESVTLASPRAVLFSGHLGAMHS